jgi:hypothetical protein
VLRQNLRVSDTFLAPEPDHRHFVELISAGASAAVDDPVRRRRRASGASFRKIGEVHESGRN